MKTIKSYIFLIALFSLSFLDVSAQKFGYVNTQELIQQIPEVKEANANIETYKTQLQKKGQDMVTALQTKYQALEAKQASGEISPRQLEAEAEMLKQEQIKIGQFEQDSQQKILEKSETLLKPIRERIQKAINEVADEQGYDYIFDFSMGVLLYADPTHDVSNSVKAKLGLQ